MTDLLELPACPWNNLTPELREKIGWFIGRDVPGSERGGMHSFEDFSESDENEFRLFHRDRILAITYIAYRLKGRASLPELVSYHSMVIEQGISFAEWNSKYR